MGWDGIIPISDVFGCEDYLAEYSAEKVDQLVHRNRSNRRSSFSDPPSPPLTSPCISSHASVQSPPAPLRPAASSCSSLADGQLARICGAHGRVGVGENRRRTRLAAAAPPACAPGANTRSRRRSPKGKAGELPALKDRFLLGPPLRGEPCRRGSRGF
jgi:hypothetical protein